MDKKEVNWNDLQLFIVVARTGGLSAASRLTKKSPATLGRRMLSLERSLGRELFVRHDKGYQLVSEGQELFKELAQVESRILQMASLVNREKKYLVKISADTWMTLYLIESINALVRGRPNLLLRFISTEKILDITHRETIIGFRNKRPTENTLVCRRVAKVEFAAYAKPDCPQNWIRVLADTPSARWLRHNIKTDTLCEVNEPRNSLDLALSGKGIAILPTFIGDSYSCLNRKSDIIEELGYDQWLVTHQEDRYLPEVRLLIDRLVNLFETPHSSCDLKTITL